MRIKKLKATDPEYLLRDEKKALVLENKKMKITIVQGVDSLMRHIDSRKSKHQEFCSDVEPDDFY